MDSQSTEYMIMNAPETPGKVMVHVDLYYILDGTSYICQHCMTPIIESSESFKQQWHHAHARILKLMSNKQLQLSIILFIIVSLFHNIIPLSHKASSVNYLHPTLCMLLLQY